MTFRRYIRLLMVLTIPLLMAGWLFARYDPFNPTFFSCEDLSQSEYCENVGWDDPFRENALNKQPAWFDINFQIPKEKSSSVSNYFTASQRVLSNVRIISATPISQPSQYAIDLMATLPSRDATIVLGMDEGEKSQVTDGVIYLYCNSLLIHEKADSYNSMCFGDGWTGSIVYTASGQDASMLRHLRLAVEEEIARVNFEYTIYQIASYPVFIYLFLLISVIVWICLVAYRFVKAG